MNPVAWFLEEPVCELPHSSNIHGRRQHRRYRHSGHISGGMVTDYVSPISVAMKSSNQCIRCTSLDVYGNPVLLSGRIPGKININTVWDPQILWTLADPQVLSNSHRRAGTRPIFDTTNLINRTAFVTK